MEITVSSEGRITLPVELRRALHIQPGDRLVLELQSDESVLMRRRGESNARALLGAWHELHDEYGSVDEAVTELRGSVER